MAKRRNGNGVDIPTPMPKSTQSVHRPVSTLEVPFKEKMKGFEQLPPNEVVTAPIQVVDGASAQPFNVQTLESNVSKCLSILDDAVMHSYVTKLSELPIVEPYFDEEKIRREPYQFFHITKLVYEQDEFSVSKLSAVFQTLSDKNCTLVLMVQNVNHVTSFYLGVRDHEEKDCTGTLRQMLEMSLKGQFAGSDFSQSFSVEDMQKITTDLKKTTKAVSCVSCVPDFKQDKDFFENKDFLQGLEKFVISMQDKDYTAVFVADAVNYDELVAYRTQLESVYTQLSPFASMQYQINTSNSQSNANTQQSSQTKTDTKGQTDTTGTSSSTAHGTTVGKTNTKGATQTHGTNSSSTDTTSKGTTVTDGTNKSVAKGTTVTDGTNRSVANGTTRTNTFNVGGGLNAGSFAGTSTSFTPFGIGKGTNSGVSGGISLNLGYARSLAKSRTETEGTTHSLAKSHTETEGTTHSNSLSETISKALTNGTTDSNAVSNSTANSNSTSNTQTSGVSSQHATNSSYSEAFNFGHAETITDTFGTSKGITMQSQNMMIVNMLERIKKQIDRLEECESMGMWNCSAYFMSGNRAISETAGHTYKSLISGENSGVERSAINTWTDGKSLPLLSTYITHFCHPRFEYISAGEPCLVSPASLISTKELAIEMSLPRKSVCGLPVIQHAVFGQQIVRNDIVSDSTKHAESVSLGKVYHLNTKTNVPVHLDLQSLTMHTFVTGSTGAGKSNTVYHILDELSEKKVPYLVIEPAKGEYKRKFNDASVYGTNPNTGELLKLNPFAFPKEVHIQEHIDRLAELFNVCWVMYAAMPAVLKDSIIRAYESAGWDMDKSVNTVDSNLFPTFEDVLREVDVVVRESDYSRDTSSDYKGALKTRLRSLTNGINGMIFSSREVPNDRLFDAKTIVDLSRVGSTETKSLIMGILVLKIQEYRMSNQHETDSDLRHVTVIEEAHNLLKKTSTEQGQEVANLQGKSVEMLTNAIAEMRTYGEGFIIVDQAPDLLDTAVIRNTNTKIVMRLPEGTDREVTGLSMALDDNQVKELSKLPQGVAVVYQNSWQEAVLCAMPKFTFVDYPRKASPYKSSYSEYVTLKLLLNSKTMSYSVLDAVVLSDAPAKVRKQLIQTFNKKNAIFEWAMADYITNRFSWKGVFNGTNRSCNTIEELGDLMVDNLRMEFPNFKRDELEKIGYYICLKAHELYPNNEEIERVRVDFFGKRCLV